MRPACNSLRRLGSASIPRTLWPSVARHADVTRPTYPRPTTATSRLRGGASSVDSARADSRRATSLDWTVRPGMDPPSLSLAAARCENIAGRVDAMGRRSPLTRAGIEMLHPDWDGSSVCGLRATTSCHRIVTFGDLDACSAVRPL